MSHVEDLLNQATNPTAYNAPDTEWVIENGKDSPRQDIYREYFLPYSTEWTGKDVLDVGSGAGWLLNYFIENGARTVMGVESSQKNIEASRTLYPKIEVMGADFMAVDLPRQFDFVTAVMVVTNFLDLEMAFCKFKSLMVDDAILMIVVPDYDYFKTPRHGYSLDMAQMNSKEYVIETKRPTVVLTDIVRKNDVYINAAETAGLRCVESVPMVPSGLFTEQLSQYKSFESQPIMHLLRFTRQS